MRITGNTSRLQQVSRSPCSWVPVMPTRQKVQTGGLQVEQCMELQRQKHVAVESCAGSDQCSICNCRRGA